MAAMEDMTALADFLNRAFQMELPSVTQPFFHEESEAVRFWVDVDGSAVGATIGKRALHYRFAPNRIDDDPLTTYHAHAAEINAAVRRRVAAGSREPVMLREWDVREGAEALPRP